MKSKVLGFKWAVVAVSLLLLFGVLAGVSVGRVGGKKAEAMTVPSDLKPGDIVHDTAFVKSVIDSAPYNTVHSFHAASSNLRDVSDGPVLMSVNSGVAPLSLVSHADNFDFSCYAVNDIPGSNEYLVCDGDFSLITDNAAVLDSSYREGDFVDKYVRHVNEKPYFRTISSNYFRLVGVSLVYGFPDLPSLDQMVWVSEVADKFSFSNYSLTIDPWEFPMATDNLPYSSIVVVFVYHYDVVGSSESSSKDPTIGSSESLPEEPSKEGYTFAGWYYGTDEEHGDGTLCVPYDGLPIVESTNLHAHWIENRSVGGSVGGGINEIGDFVDANPWFVWVFVGIGFVLVCFLAVCIANVFRR